MQQTIQFLRPVGTERMSLSRDILPWHEPGVWVGASGLGGPGLRQRGKDPRESHSPYTKHLRRHMVYRTPRGYSVPLSG